MLSSSTHASHSTRAQEQTSSKLDVASELRHGPCGGLAQGSGGQGRSKPWFTNLALAVTRVSHPWPLPAPGGVPLCAAFKGLQNILGGLHKQ